MHLFSTPPQFDHVHVKQIQQSDQSLLFYFLGGICTLHQIHVPDLGLLSVVQVISDQHQVIFVFVYAVYQDLELESVEETDVAVDLDESLSWNLVQEVAGSWYSFSWIYSSQFHITTLDLVLDGTEIQSLIFEIESQVLSFIAAESIGIVQLRLEIHHI